MDKQGNWSLAPAFDLTYAYDPLGKWTKVHQIRLSGKQTNFVLQDLLKFGAFCDIKTRKANAIIDRTLTAFEQFNSKAQLLEINEEFRAMIYSNLRLNWGAR